MSLRSRWVQLGSACLMVVALSFGHAGAADKARLDQATDQVVEAARSIHYGEIGSGTKDMVVGIGITIVEGTVYAGKTIGEFFKKTFSGG
jgi:hypothetical protein